MRLEVTKRFNTLWLVGAVLMGLSFLVRGGPGAIGKTIDPPLFLTVVGLAVICVTATMVLALTGRRAWAYLLWGLTTVGYGLLLPSLLMVLAGLCFIGCVGITRKPQQAQAK
jgi:hypothetical protein